MTEKLTLALSKGRILDQTLPLLSPLGIEPLEDPEESRNLVLPTTNASVRLIIVRATDVPTYVAYGGADLGVAGKDVLMEQGGHGLYEPVDLGIARCRLMVAGHPDVSLTGRRLRVATKFVNITRRYFADKGRQVDLIKLYGSMELAPLVGLSDLIVDLVDTGNTLRANGLEPLEHIADISSRLVVNKASMKLRHRELKPLIGRIAETANERAQR
ncbi:ATP phosphoribosyltransferase [Spiribacter vilamensis]|uniref:ATP phosphoribosyltransferase n=1 Tax=Spiribacter vilamensis TaxID=531306 RepID=A0A4Q8CY50_9GAMM|nr:ATP phosphoribosyltransferase [Spiribacter vilamensis]RZU97893.1 ATP phosphoribosyltransferase (homohexameric) [Spiribacter vilamensis]TVO61192.1 ATP phosphoribosyltransferase [Spiribacter vilamensis]